VLTLRPTAHRAVLFFLIVGLLGLTALPGPQRAQARRAAPPLAVPPALPDNWVKALHWRCIGPAGMGGRIVALSVYETDPTTWWVATASGGLLKTTNNGVTFEHQFDREATVSIGDVCVAPSNPNIVWVGTGENNPRNSVSYGDGVYKSTDGGKTWKNMGLKKTYQIGRIVVHPRNPDIVYVGALGRLYGPHPERGLFKTTDGGKNWQLIHHVDDRTGVIEVKMHPKDPETLLIATWERRRDMHDSHAGAMTRTPDRTTKLDPPLAEGYDAYDPQVKWGAGGGIFKTTDGGKSFRKLTRGLPTNPLGRIGLDYFRGDPNVVFAVVDCEKIGMGTLPPVLGVFSQDTPQGVRLTGVREGGPGAAAGLKVGDILTAIDKKPVAKQPQLGELIRAHKVGDKVVVGLLRDGKPMEVTATLGPSPEAVPPPPRLGIQAVDVPTGVEVGRVEPRGAAARAGLLQGDVIQAMDKKKLANLKELLTILQARKPGDKVTLQILRAKETKEIVVTVPRGGRPPSSTRPYAFWYGGQRENVQDQQGPDSFQYGGVFKSTDGGESWTRINSVNPRPMYFSQIRVDPSDAKYLYVLGIRLYVSGDGGKTFRMGGDAEVHPDQHALWIDPRDGRHMIIGTDGGFYATYDRGAHWDFLDTKAIGQFYHVCVDSRQPYHVYGGLQDNGSWGGPSRSLDGRGTVNTDWIMVGGGDGFVCRVDPTDSNVVYFESQDGNTIRRNLRNGRFTGVRPQQKPGLRPYRFNWNTPFILSSHNPRLYYSAGNYVFRSLKRGEETKPISPELSTNSKASATALAESPRNADVLWAGTDDGNLWVTRDGGAKWDNVAARVGLPKPSCVSTIETSRFKEGRAYVAFDAHRSDDDEPYIYVTEDFGQTWKSLRGNLPAGSSRVLREDLENQDLLYLGTEFAAWASLDRGGHWTKINNNLPTVAVHEFAQHPTAGEVVAATHGRSLWILDVAALRQVKRPARRAAVNLFRPTPAVRWRSVPRRGTIYGMGSRGFVGENPPAGAPLYYSLAHKAKKLQITIRDYEGKQVAAFGAPVEPGLHRVVWNLQGAVAGGPRRRRGFFGGPFVPPGQYRVVLNVDGVEHSQGLVVEPDPVVDEARTTAEVEAAEARKKRPMRSAED
jgi:photosystem II stability/assembly factor-like uncharacterized protein